MTKKLLIVDYQTGITKVVGLIARQLGLEFKALNDSATRDGGVHRVPARHPDPGHDHA